MSLLQKNTKAVIVIRYSDSRKREMTQIGLMDCSVIASMVKLVLTRHEISDFRISAPKNPSRYNDLYVTFVSPSKEIIKTIVDEINISSPTNMSDVTGYVLDY